MKLAKYIFAVIFCTSLLFGSERFKWTEIDFPDKINTYKIIDVDSNNVIWVYDLRFNIYKRVNNNWIKFNSPYPDSLDTREIIKIDDHKYFAWAFDQKYQSYIRIFDFDHWSTLQYTIDVPINNVLKNDANDYYIHANFGRLIRLKDYEFTPVENPFKNHIWSAIKTKDSTIWFGTKYDGIFKYRDNIFTKVEFADHSNYEIRYLIDKNDTIYAYQNQFNIFELNDNKFVRTKKQLDQITGSRTKPKIGITSLSFLKDDKRIKLSYPSRLKPSQFYAKDDSLIYLITNNKLLEGTRYDNFYFYELAPSYLIDGADQSTSTQGFFNDFNNDGYNDLLVINTYPPELNSMYVGNYSYPFQERLFKLDGSLENLASRVYEFADLNKDFYDDVIVSINDSNGTGISIFWNNKDFTFTKHTDLYSPDYLSKSGIRGIQAVDFDNDGDMDINLSYYYGNEDQPGNEIFFINTFNGQKFELDTTYKSIAKGWDVNSIFADVDNDGDLDWYIAMLWWKDKLFLNEDGKYVNVSQTHLSDSTFLNTHGACFSDIDNDGDIDLIKTSDEQLIAIALNNGSGIFTDASDSLINRFYPLKIFTYSGYKSLNTFDVNNDGFTDILLTSSYPKGSKTILFLNNNGKSFYKYDDFTLEENEPVYTSAIADIDYDGDLDIYLLKNGKNQLLVNNLDDKNFVRLKLIGVTSETSAKNSKIWVYKKGGLNNKDSLVIYRETGIENSSIIHKNEDIIHLGLSTKNEYDIKIRFLSGKEIILTNIKPPFRQTVYEEEGFYKDAIILGYTLFNLIMNRDIQYYTLIILLTIIIIGLSIRYGHERFNWDIRLSIGLIIVNFSLFWIILLLAYDSQSYFLKFIFPSVIASFGVVIPILVFLSLKTNIVKRNLSEYKDELLNQMINFSHGEWALKNINSLIFLQQSIPEDISNNEKFKLQLINRINTFNTLTTKSLEKIIALTNQIDFEKESTRLLIQTLAEIKVLNNKIMSNNFSFTDKEKKLFVILKEIIRLLRNKIISEYSCNPIDIINKVLETNKSIIKENKVNVEFIYPSDLRKMALIKANELADIIDNSIGNAIKSFTKEEGRTIYIEMKWVAPKFRITVLNNGEEIPQKNREKIFEKGFSTLGSSGIGLFNSRNILRKYGGRLLLQSSTNKWTNFLIELNEGFINETAYSNN